MYASWHVLVLINHIHVYFSYTQLPTFLSNVAYSQVSRDVYIQLIDVEDETSSNFEVFTYISGSYDSNV